MKHFLNDFMKEKRDLSGEALNPYDEVFAKTFAFIRATLGDRPFRPERSLNTAVFDAVATAMAKRLQSGTPPSPEDTKAAYDGLFSNDRFIEGYIRSTADAENVKKRMDEAQRAFDSI